MEKPKCEECDSEKINVNKKEDKDKLSFYFECDKCGKKIKKVGELDIDEYNKLLKKFEGNVRKSKTKKRILIILSILLYVLGGIFLLVYLYS